MVIENTVPATAMVEEAMAPSTARAPAGPPRYSQMSSTRSCGGVLMWSRRTKTYAATTPASTINPGMTQKASSRSLSSLRWRAIIG
jgi:hypothetical protein